MPLVVDQALDLTDVAVEGEDPLDPQVGVGKEAARVAGLPPCRERSPGLLAGAVGCARAS